MFEKIVNDLRECAEFNYCSECHVDNCTAGDDPDREACLFNLAANIIESLEEENKNLQKTVDHLTEELSEVRSELSWMKYPERMGQ